MNLGIIGGGQLGSLLSVAAKKLDIKTTIYSDDPEKNSSAQKYESISFDKVIKRKLSVMDLTAFTLCQENNLPIKVFNMNIEGNLIKVCKGQNVGTLVESPKE